MDEAGPGAAAAPRRCRYVECPIAWERPPSPLWEPDQLHFSADGYAALGARLAPTVASALIEWGSIEPEGAAVGTDDAGGGANV